MVYCVSSLVALVFPLRYEKKKIIILIGATDFEIEKKNYTHKFMVRFEIYQVVLIVMRQQIKSY